MTGGMSKGRKRLLVNIVTAVFVLLLFLTLSRAVSTGAIGRYPAGILNSILINITLAVSLNMVTGLMGQLVLGHAGFMMVGAYSAALFTTNLGWSLSVSLPIALLIGGMVAALFGVIVGVPALRLKGDYLAIITLGFGEIIRTLAINLDGITNGVKGYSVTSYFPGNHMAKLFNYIFIVAVITIYVSYTYGTSRHGRAVISIREDEIAAESIGIQTTYYKLLTFVIAAFFAGVAGGLAAHRIPIINPNDFDFNRSVEILVMVVLGGMGSITGAVISATVLTALPEILRLVGGSNFQDYRMLVYSIVLIMVMLFRPKGLLGRREFSLTKILDRFVKDKNPNRRMRGGA